ncbi:hypothetical protein AHF37_07845 [Paragonimus kellicotti]|nr:hypothetical protein AHF37_07845 [Paragonimus kellicotti]
MLQLQQFLEVNTPILSELRNLELIRIKLPSPTSRISSLTRRIYIELLTQFEATFPKPCTSVHFLHWAFIRTRIANTFLECSEPNKAYDWLHVILENTKELSTIHSLIYKLQHPVQSSATDSVDYDKGELILFNLLAGLLQTLFNLLAASAHCKHRAASEPCNTARDSTLLTRADAITSLDWLQCAKRVHELYVEHNSPYTGPTFWETIVLKDLMYQISGDVSIEESGVDWLPKRLTPERLLFEHGYTNTIFLLAQAYQLADEPVHAAVCCQLTLSRQLSFAQPLKELAQFAKSFRDRSRPRAVSARRSKDVNQSIFGHMRRRFACYVSSAVQPFDPVEWATNAAALSNYHLSTEEANGYYYATLECLVSACAIIDRADVHVAVAHKSAPSRHPPGDPHMTDREQKARANIYRGLGLFGLSLLEKGSMAKTRSFYMSVCRQVQTYIQAYQLADEPVHAAVCCQLTLSRQLSFAQPLKELAQFAKSFRDRSRPRAVSARRSKDVNQSIFGHMRRRFACYVSSAVQPFDPVEWATNAAALSNYHLSTEEANGYYYATLECLVSACAIIDRADVHVAVAHKSAPSRHPPGDPHMTDREQKARANIYRGLGLFGLSLLEKGSMAVTENPKLLHEHVQTSTNLHPAEDFGTMFQLRLGLFLRRLVSGINAGEPNSLSLISESDSQKKLSLLTANGESASVETYVNMLATCPTTYDAAALVFRLTSYGLSQASQYYTMDEHCSDAVVIGQNLSKAYRLMATFELNESRQCCIHKRRIDY